MRAVALWAWGRETEVSEGCLPGSECRSTEERFPSRIHPKLLKFMNSKLFNTLVFLAFVVHQLLQSLPFQPSRGQNRHHHEHLCHRHDHLLCHVPCLQMFADAQEISHLSRGPSCECCGATRNLSKLQATSLLRYHRCSRVLGA